MAHLAAAANLHAPWASGARSTPLPSATRSCRKYNIKRAGEGSGLNPVRWRQGDRHGLTLTQITDTGVKTISCVQRLAGHIHLRHKLAPAGCPNGEMNVGRAPRI